MSYFVGQTLIIKLDTGKNLAGYNGTIIYKKPNASVGEWPASIYGNFLSCTVQGSDIDQSGSWKLQAKITKASNTYYGQLTSISFDKILQ